MLYVYVYLYFFLVNKKRRVKSEPLNIEKVSS